jgi:hypothetical protein
VAVDRTHVRDGADAVVGRLDVWHRFPGGQERRTDHHVLQEVVLLGGELVEGVDMLEAGDVHDVAQGPLLRGRFDDGFHLALRAQFGLDREKAPRGIEAVDRLGGLFHPLGVDVCPHDSQSVRRERDGDGPADARRRARHERDVVGVKSRIVEHQQVLSPQFRCTQIEVVLAHTQLSKPNKYSTGR